MRYHIIITFKNEKPTENDKQTTLQYTLDVDAKNRADALQQGRREADIIKSSLRTEWNLDQITAAPMK